MYKLLDIANDLRNAIRSGRYEVGKRIPSEVELTDVYHASTITINKALNMLVNEGYLHRPGARRNGTFVRMQRPYPQGYLAIIFAHLSCPFCMKILSGAVRAAELYNYMVVPFSTESNVTELLQRLEAARFSGILTTSPDRLHTEIPVTYIDTFHYEREEELYQVRCNAYDGGRKIAKALLKAGHRNIVYCSFWLDNRIESPRKTAFIETMRENGITDIDKRLFHGDSEPLHSARNVLRKLIKQYPDFTAMVCWNDPTALWMMRAGREIGIDLGGKITLAGFGNLPEIQRLNPFLTVEQFPAESGYSACCSLIRRLEHPEEPHPHLEELDVELINEDRVIPVSGQK